MNWFTKPQFSAIDVLMVGSVAALASRRFYIIAFLPVLVAAVIELYTQDL